MLDSACVNSRMLNRADYEEVFYQMRGSPYDRLSREDELKREIKLNRLYDVHDQDRHNFDFAYHQIRGELEQADALLGKLKDHPNASTKFNIDLKNLDANIQCFKNAGYSEERIKNSKKHKASDKNYHQVEKLKESNEKKLKEYQKMKKTIE